MNNTAFNKNSKVTYNLEVPTSIVRTLRAILTTSLHEYICNRLVVDGYLVDESLDKFVLVNTECLVDDFVFELVDAMQDIDITIKAKGVSYDC